MADKFLIHGAFLKCDKGASPSQLLVTSNPGVYIQGVFAGTEADKIPLVNIQTFGVCAVTGNPCIPAPLLWTDTDPFVELFGNAALLQKSCLNCSVGGLITAVESGQSPATVLPASGISNNGPSLAFVGALGFTEALTAAEITALAGEAAVAAEATVAVAETSAAVAVLEGTMATTGVLVADDVTGIGVADDVAIPFVVVGGLIIAGCVALWEWADEPEVITLPPSSITVPRPVTYPPGEVETEPDPFLLPSPEAPTLPKPPTVQSPTKQPKPKPLAKPKDDPISLPIPLPPAEPEEEDPCIPKDDRNHLGGDTYHDWWADTFPPNLSPGKDWYLRGRNVPKGKYFDAYSPTGDLWEIKTDDYATYATFVKRIQLTKIMAEALSERAIAASCAIPFYLGILDPQEYTEIITSNILFSSFTVLMI